jgi:hypothetical protein
LEGGCPCEGLEGWKLVLCIAPPRGEYELSYELGKGVIASISREGVRIRQLKAPGYLPYLESIEREVKIETLEAMGLKPERVICDAVKALREASKHGSEAAADIVEKCRGLIERLEERCSKRG